MVVLETWNRENQDNTKVLNSSNKAIEKNFKKQQIIEKISKEITWKKVFETDWGLIQRPLQKTKVILLAFQIQKQKRTS